MSGGTVPVRPDASYSVDLKNEPLGTTLRLYAGQNGARRAALSPVAVVTRASLHPRIATYASAYMRSDKVWVTTVWGYGIDVDLQDVPIVLQRRSDDQWIDTPDAIQINPDGSFNLEFDSEPVGSTFRLRTPAAPYREAAYSTPVTIDAIAWQPEVTLKRWDTANETDQDGVLHQTGHYAGTSTAPSAEVNIQYRYPEQSPTWFNCGSSNTASDGSFDFTTPACPDAAEIRAILPQTGPALEATSSIATSHLDPWQFTTNSEREFTPFYSGRGALITFDATAGQSITLSLLTGFRNHHGLTYRVYGPTGSEVPVQVLEETYDQPEMLWIDPPLAGTYTLVLGFESDLQTDWIRVMLVASKDVTGPPTQETFHASTVSGQILNYQFTLAKKGGFSMSIIDPEPSPWRDSQDWCTRQEDFLGGGGPIPRLFHNGAVIPPPSILGTWPDLPAGDYTLKMFPCNDALGNLQIQQDLTFAATS